MDPIYFPIRHLSPAGAVCLETLLNETRPQLVLVEGPSDLNRHIEWICHPETRFPITIINYNLQEPVVSILYPFAEYSPEVVAMQWAHRHQVPCRFMDLPAGTFLYDAYQQKIHDIDIGESFNQIIYRLKTIDKEDYESLWEYYFEQLDDIKEYTQRSMDFGLSDRTHDENDGIDIQTGIDQFREPWMKREILKAIHNGIPADKIVCVCGSYHVKGLQTCDPISEEMAANPPTIPYESTLMPYSYERLSMQSGYGAGNECPAYYDMLYHALKNHTLDSFPEEYLIRIAQNHPDSISPAEIIDTSRLARQLASLRNRNRPILRDLQDAALTTIGHHSTEALARAMYMVEIGDKTGYLPQDAINTPLQQDFKRQIKKLDLESYHSTIYKTLRLNLKENIHTTDPAKKYIDLYRSGLLHQLRILDIPFGKLDTYKDSPYVPEESWQVAWSMHTDMRLVEASMLGDTIANACINKLSENASKASNLKEIVDILKDAILSQLTEITQSILKTLQSMAIDSSSFIDIAQTAYALSEIVQFGSIRQFNHHSLIPIIGQLYTRACLMAESACHCNMKAEPDITRSIHLIQKVTQRDIGLNTSQWTNSLLSIAHSQSVNAKCAGFATAILLENNIIDNIKLSNLISQRLSPGMDAEKSVYWFEGLASKNHQSLIHNSTLWEHLDQFIRSLEQDKFWRTLVFLRRTFAQFSLSEKKSIIERLGQMWSVNTKHLNEVVENTISPYEQSILDDINQFDFDNI